MKGLVALVGERAGWEAHGACRGLDPDLFFPGAATWLAWRPPRPSAPAVLLPAPASTPHWRGGRSGGWAGRMLRQRRTVSAAA
jgi:hypothetical protein